MLAVLIIIGVIGIGLPVALWLIARRRKFDPEKPWVHGEVNKWLLREYGLGSRDRAVIQDMVLGRYAATLDKPPFGPASQAPASLRPELIEAARGLAARVVADGFRTLRVARRLGWAQMAMGIVALVVYGVWVLTADWRSNPVLNVYTALEGILLVPAGAYSAIIIPRRRCRSARDYLAEAWP